jgi:transcriptional regulator with XRE-family HTH domain
MSEQPTNELIALGRTVRELREKRGMSAADLAAAAGIERGRLDALEAGRFDPAYDVLHALAAGLGVEAGALVRRAERAGDLDAHVAIVAFGQRLRELRTERGVSQEDIAYRAGVHPTAIGRLEAGRRDPRLTTILRLARGLGVKSEALTKGLTATEGEA